MLNGLRPLRVHTNTQSLIQILVQILVRTHAERAGGERGSGGWKSISLGFCLGAPGSAMCEGFTQNVSRDANRAMLREHKLPDYLALHSHQVSSSDQPSSSLSQVLFRRQGGLGVRFRLGTSRTRRCICEDVFAPWSSRVLASVRWSIARLRLLDRFGTSCGLASGKSGGRGGGSPLLPSACGMAGDRGGGGRNSWNVCLATFVGGGIAWPPLQSSSLRLWAMAHAHRGKSSALAACLATTASATDAAWLAP